MREIEELCPFLACVLVAMTDPELKQWSNFRAAVRGEVGVHQQKREWIWGPCVT